MDYSKFDKQYDSSELAKQVGDYEKNGGSGDFEKVPYGVYEVRLNKCELTESKAGKPMVTMTFKVVSGDYKNRLIFLNQVVTQDFQFHIVNELLRSFDTDIDVHFDSYKQYGQLLLDVAEAVEKEHLEFALDYSQGKKGYDQFQINEVFESDSDIPF